MTTTPNNSDSQREKDNRYAVPASGYVATGRSFEPSAWTYIWTTFLCLWSGYFVLSFSRVIKAFTELFKGFGSDLPAITLFFIGNVAALVSVFAAILLVQLAFYVRFLLIKNAMSRTVVALCAGVNILFQFMTVYAMYAPIFKLGSVV